ncbi:MAG: hypothetical protein JNK79_11005 [Chitinophagaceae bacterium]|nr:hypothetical protein [Chitinophagaceae bacterium]
MKRILLTVFIIFQFICLKSQVKPPDARVGVFSEWRNIQQANKELNYIGIGPWRINGKGEVPPLFEAQIRQPFLLMRGRDNQRPWRRSLAFSFNLGLNLRMYQGSENKSYPVRPINFMAPGFSVDYLLNHLFRSMKSIALEDSSHIKNFFTAQIYLSHYSNGQSGSFYSQDSLTSNKVDGNFSTNFIQPQLTWSRYLENSGLVSAAINWRHDFGIGDALGIEEGLRNSYGFNRLNLILQYKTGNVSFGRYRYQEAYYKKTKADTSKVVTQVRNMGRYTRYVSWLFRAEFGEIIGNVDNYPTFRNRSSEKLRGSIRFTAGYYPANARTLGLFAQVYYGRDYYNIRYTDKLLNIKAGFLFDLDKHIPPNTKYIAVPKARTIHAGDLQL